MTNDLNREKRLYEKLVKDNSFKNVRYRKSPVGRVLEFEYYGRSYSLRLEEGRVFDMRKHGMSHSAGIVKGVPSKTELRDVLDKHRLYSK